MSRCIRIIRLLIGGLTFLFILLLPAFSYMEEFPSHPWWMALLAAAGLWVFCGLLCFFLIEFLFQVFDWINR
jgi:hypothetical protein